MACVNHPDVPEVTRCDQCRRRVCQDCFVTIEGRALCADCKDQVVRRVERGETLTNQGRGPSPWERQRSFASLVETVKLVLFSPALFFRGLSREGHGHLTFALAAGWPAIAIGMIIQFAPSFVMALISGANRSEMPLPAAAMILLVGAAFLLLAPLQILLGIFIGGLIVHVCLMVCGAANAPLATTIRSVAFAQGANVFAAVPFCGFMIAGVWVLVAEIIGLREMHESTYARVITAVLLPSVLCCLAVMGVLSLVTLPNLLRGH
jgi:hypothetical protein